VHVIGAHVDDNNPSFQIGTNLITAHGEDGEGCLGRFPESICAETVKTLLSANQIRNAGHIVNDVPLKCGGKQHIKCLEGPVIPLCYKQALCQMKTSKPTRTEIETLTVIDFTLALPWDHRQEQDDEDIAPHDLRDINNFATRIIMLSDDAAIRDDVMMEAEESMHVFDNWNSVPASVNQITTKKKIIDWSKMVPCFAWKPQNVVERTFDCTTQFYRTTNGRLHVRRSHKNRTAALCAQRLDEACSTDTVDSSVPAIAGGKTSAQVFVSVKSKCASVHGMCSVSEFPEALKDFILDTGAPHTLISDNHNAETSEKVKKMQRECGIKGRTSEPKKQNQNFCERHIQDFKRGTIKLLDRTGAPNFLWLFALPYIILVHNLTAIETLGWITPFQKAFGTPPDASMLTKFHLCQPVCCLECEHNSFPSEKELLGWWLGPANNTGDAFCSHIHRTNNTVVPRSVLRPAHDNPLHVNKRQSSGEVLFQNNNAVEESTTIAPEDNDTPTEIDLQSLLNSEFIHHIGPHGYRAKVTECYQDQDKHLISIGNGNKEEIVTCDHMLDVINKRLEEVEDKDAHDTLWFLELLDTDSTMIRKNTVLWSDGAPKKKHGSH